MKAKLKLLGFALTFVSVALALGGPGASETSDIQKLNSADPRERKAVAADLVARAQGPRAEVIEQLASVIRANPQKVDVQFFAPKALAIEALGKLKGDESIPVLVAEIEYRAAEIVDADVPWAGMPAVRALIDIGFPSVKYVLQRGVLEAASPEALRRFALVVRYVFPDAKTARVFIEVYDPAYTDGARVKHGELRKLLAELP